MTAGMLPAATAATTKEKSKPFGYCFNTSCVRGQKLTLDQQVDLVIKAGYEGIEPWIRDMQAFKESGGSLKDLGKRLADNNVLLIFVTLLTLILPIVFVFIINNSKYKTSE